MKNLYYNIPDDEEEIKNLLLFRKIVSVEQYGDQQAKISLDNGVKLTTYGNEGCGGCGNGWFYLTELNGCDNAITNVELVEELSGEWIGDLAFKIYIYSEDKKTTLLSYEGYDNGYYGIGYSVEVQIEE